MLGNFSLFNKGTMRARALPLARALVRRGHEVGLVLASLDAPSAGGVVREEAGVRVQHVAPVGPTGWRQLAATAALARAAGQAEADVVHAFKPIAYAGAAGALLTAAARLPGPRPRVVFDADDWEGTGGWADLDRRPAWQRWLIDRQERWNLRHCDGLTVASRQLAALALALGAKQEKVHYLPNGVEAVSGPPTVLARAAARDRLGLGSSPIVLLYTRFAEYPVAQVVRLLRQVVAVRPDVRLLVVGRGLRGEEKELARSLAAASLQDSVLPAGWIEPESLPVYLTAADIAIYPFADTLVNRTKCPAKLVELLAAGLPVVAERVGQTGEYVVHGESGWLVPPGDESAFAEAVLTLLSDPAERQVLAQGAVARVAGSFLWDHLAGRAEAAYGAIASSKGGRRLAGA